MQVAAAVGAGNAAKSSAGSTLIRSRVYAGLTDVMSTMTNAAALKPDSTPMITVVAVITVTALYVGKQLQCIL